MAELVVVRQHGPALAQGSGLRALHDGFGFLGFGGLGLGTYGLGFNSLGFRVFGVTPRKDAVPPQKMDKPQSAQEQLAQLWSFQGMAPEDVRSVTWGLADISCRIMRMQLWQSGGARIMARTCSAC